MNIDDMDAIDHQTPGDMLKGIFERQRELLHKYSPIELKTLPCIVPGTAPVDIDSYHGQHVIKERLYNTIIELAEVADCMKNKAWKQSMIQTDVRHLKEEVADALHFFIEMCILIGIDADELFDLYSRKSEINKFRQRSKY